MFGRSRNQDGPHGPQKRRGFFRKQGLGNRPRDTDYRDNGDGYDNRFSRRTRDSGRFSWSDRDRYENDENSGSGETSENQGFFQKLFGRNRNKSNSRSDNSRSSSRGFFKNLFGNKRNRNR